MSQNGLNRVRIGQVARERRTHERRGGRARSGVGLLAAFLVAALLGVSQSASALVLDVGDGFGNTTRPLDDPGFENVGEIGGVTAVYLGNRWVITANHAGLADLVFLNETYAYLPLSVTRLENPDQTLADLRLLRLDGEPSLPGLEIATSSPNLNTIVTLIARGWSRGPEISWMGVDGYEWINVKQMRWGTSRVTAQPSFDIGTEYFATEFKAPGAAGRTSQESIPALADSGGGVFFEQGPDWKLGGIMLSLASFQGQPEDTSLYGNLGLYADLAVYRSQILSIIQQPSCSDGLDDDGDGLIDHPADPGCSGPGDGSEHDPALVCDDGEDNDGDGVADFPADPECLSATHPTEAVAAVPALGSGGTILLGVLLLLGGSRSGHAGRRHGSYTP